MIGWLDGQIIRWSDVKTGKTQKHPRNPKELNLFSDGNLFTALGNPLGNLFAAHGNTTL